MSLRWRWALGLGMVAALAIGLTTSAAIVSAKRQLQATVDVDLRERAVEVNRWAGALLTNGRNVPRRLQPRIIDFDAVVQAFDTDGTVVLRMGREGVAPPIEATDLAVLAGGRRSLIRDVRIDGTPYRMITLRVARATAYETGPLAFQIATDRSRVDTNLKALTRSLVLIGVVGVLLVAFTGWVLASRAVRPVEDLTEAAEQIAFTEQLDTGGQLDTSAPGEIGRLAAAFSSMLGALSASRHQQQRLVSDAGHEFRTPITALKTNLEILRRQGDSLSSRQRAELVEAAHSESNQLAALAAELVDLASDVHHTDEKITNLDLELLATEVANRHRRVGDRKIVVSGKGATVTGRRSQLERALGNLVDNGIKWASANVEIVLDGSTVTVIDDGPGVAEHEIQHIFERFYRSREARSTPGTGLGLAIVEHLVVAHGGTVFARNAQSGGAEVGFTLPVAHDP